ncbi:MAG: helix-turn-helix domain-containing protein [Humibacillus sp.]|nr:helix-turn-helix domain-containing protein [Humibacillus sp.]MDN5777733.1 helix-turn-helix domain-containing protein [Humibacillus sp.]
MSSDVSRWITTTEAAQRLGVKRATLYAYVSRGQLHSERRSGQQESLFDRGEIDALASSARPAGAPQPVLRFRSVATAVSAQRDGDLFYRGVPLTQVATLGLDRAAALVMGDADSVPSDLPGVNPAVAQAIASLSLERRMPVAVQALASADPFGPDTDPPRIRSTALALVPRAVALLGGSDADLTGDPSSSTTDRLTRITMHALGGRPGSPAELEVLRVMLIALLDHGLTASTVAARVAASTRAGVHDCLCAAYAAMAGPLHGAAPAAAHGLLAFEGSAKDAVAESFRRHGDVPGFGHFLYPEGDPRADLVLEALAGMTGTTRLRRRMTQVAEVVEDRTGRHPNVDLAGAAVLHALDLPPAAGEVFFQIARSFGVAAHVIEEYAEQPLRWRGREATG